MSRIVAPVEGLTTNFSPLRLNHIFHDKLSQKRSRGIDGVSAPFFATNIKDTNRLIRRKVTKGEYKFSPYVENQISRGREKTPRILSIPTIRDQLALSALKNYLHANFPDSVNHQLPNSIIFDLKQKLASVATDGPFSFVRTDISSFYDSIDREKLMNMVRSKVSDREAHRLIYRIWLNLGITEIFHS